MPIVEHPLLTAANVHAALHRELDWLRIAAGCYDSDRFQRLVSFSADRLHQVINEYLTGGCEGVRFKVDPTVEQAKAPIAVDILWKGKRSAAVVRAWSQILQSGAKA